MTGYRSGVKRSPAAITSDRRKKTRLSPSVCAAGRCISSTGSPLKNMSFCLTKKLSVGQPSLGRASLLSDEPFERISDVS